MMQPNLAATIEPGPHRHTTRLGPIDVNVQLADSTVEAVCAAMERAGITPIDCYSATPIGETGRFTFEVWQQLPDGDWSTYEVTA